MGKGENAGKQHFLLFSQCFLPVPNRISDFQGTSIPSTANALNLDRSKNLSFCKGLIKSRLSSANAFNFSMFQKLWLSIELTHSHTMTPFDTPVKQTF